MEEKKEEDPTKVVDIYRDTPVRYLGYANEVGESFRAFVHVGVVRLTYVLASAYVCADAVSKGRKTYQMLNKKQKISQEKLPKDIPQSSIKSALLKESSISVMESSISASISRETIPVIWREVGVVVLDTLVWQTFASVIIPGFTINRLCFFKHKMLQRFTKVPLAGRKVVVTMFALACIPFIIHPIDHLVDFAMDNSLRKTIHK